jgi:hypothetical protein
VRPGVHGRRGFAYDDESQQRSALRSAGSKGWRESSKFDIAVGTLGWLFGIPP